MQHIFIAVGDESPRLSTLKEEEIAEIIEELGGSDDQDDTINYFFATIAELKEAIL